MIALIHKLALLLLWQPLSKLILSFTKEVYIWPHSTAAQTRDWILAAQQEMPMHCCY